MADLNSAFDSEKSLDSDFDAEGGGSKGYPNPDAKSNPQAPVSPERSLLQRFLSPPGHGAAGGFVGGVVGGLSGGIPGAMAGAFAGNVASQGQSMTPEQAGLRPPGLAGLTRRGGFQRPSAPTSDTPDYAAAGVDAGVQGALGGALKLGGMGAAKLGYPRLAAILGAKTPMQAVVDSTPAAVKGVGTPALQAVDAATLSGNPAAKELAGVLAEQARRNANLAVERGISEQAMAPIQSRMPTRVPGLAQASGEYANKLRDLGLPEDLTRKAFADGPSVMEAAENLPAMQARQQMVQQAVPQTVDNQALKLARRPLAAAEARGVSASPTSYAADAAGLRELGGVATPNNSYLTRIANKVPGMGNAAQLLPEGGMTADRVAQTTGATLASRGESTVNPMLEKLLSTNPAYKAGAVTPQFIEDLLRRFGSR